MNLSKAEEQLMQYLWEHEGAFMKDLMQSYPDPKPATTTVATLLKRMIDKGYVAYKVYGNSREYYALVSKKDYSTQQLQGFIKGFFNGSSSQFASFFAKNTDLTKEELEDLRSMIDKKIDEK
ncbi:MAG: BlaI/MecI/CopY family transcriptional regulator [Bacteroidota bacterium]